MRKKRNRNEKKLIGRARKRVKYQIINSCNKCGSGKNRVTRVLDSVDGGLTCEATTECGDCGHKDLWLYGFFESASEPDFVSKAKTR